jgi:hypothetical protein
VIAHQNLKTSDDLGHPREAECHPGMRCSVIELAGSGFRVHRLACSLSEETPLCANATCLARSHVQQNLVGSAGHPIPVGITSAQAAATRNYVRRIPDPAQQGYAEEYLVWALAGKPQGGGPLMRCFGLSLAAGCQLAATVERLLGLTPIWPGRRRRR